MGDEARAKSGFDCWSNRLPAQLEVKHDHCDFILLVLVLILSTGK